MTRTQFDRWRDFACRLAEHGYPEATRARRDKVKAEVSDFLDWYKDSFADVEGWDGSTAGVYVCDDLQVFFSNRGLHPRRQDDCEPTRYQSQISACVRAGLDIASAPSAGVLGFTVDTLRSMYAPEAIPEWVRVCFDPPLSGDEQGELGVWL